MRAARQPRVRGGPQSVLACARFAARCGPFLHAPPCCGGKKPCVAATVAVARVWLGHGPSGPTPPPTPSPPPFVPRLSLWVCPPAVLGATCPPAAAVIAAGAAALATLQSDAASPDGVAPPPAAHGSAPGLGGGGGGLAAAAGPLTFMDAVRGMPWNLVPFVLGMFILVEALTACGFIHSVAEAGATAIGTSPLRGTLISGCT
jgi:hypothetical protein